MSNFDGHTRFYQRACKRCGKPRYDGCSHALCYEHFAEYMREKKQQTVRHKEAGIIIAVGRHKP